MTRSWDKNIRQICGIPPEQEAGKARLIAEFKSYLDQNAGIKRMLLTIAKQSQPEFIAWVGHQIEADK